MPSMDYPIPCQCTRRPESCDLHVVPPVCVCEVPRFEGRCHCDRSHATGECRNCHKPYKPEVPGFDAIREAWLAQLDKEPAA